jgi:hypothetical protein
MDIIAKTSPARIARVTLAILLGFIPAFGCSSPSDAPPDLAASDLATDDAASPSLNPTVSCNPDNVVTGTVTMNLSSVSSVRIEYGPDTSYGLNTPTVTNPPDGSASFPLLGLTPGGTSHVRVDVSYANGVQADSGDLTVSCPALPAGMPSFAGVSAPASGGFLLVSVQNRTPTYAVAALVDRAGRLYWYRQQPSVGDFDRTHKGNFVSYNGNGYDVVSLSGQLFRSVTDPLASRGGDNHEYVSLGNRHALIFGQNTRAVDTTSYVDGGVPDASEIENTITELDGDGGVVSHWPLGNQITLAETTPDINLSQSPIDAQHANSIGVLADGNLLVSLRHTDTLYKLNRSDGNVLWRLGGKQSDFTFVNDPLNGFSHQHYARELANGHILLFDDGNLHSPPLSRVTEYALDEAAHTATLVWDYRHPGLVSTCCGSTARLDSGNTLTAWGTTGVIDEADPSGTVVWQMTIPSAILYRAIPIPSLYP